jgi:hypothetical protein
MMNGKAQVLLVRVDHSDELGVQKGPYTHRVLIVRPRSLVVTVV